MTDHERLKARQRAERDTHPEDLALRVHRALSWLRRSEQLATQEDVDGQVVFLWMDHPANLWGLAASPAVN